MCVCLWASMYAFLSTRRRRFFCCCLPFNSTEDENILSKMENAVDVCARLRHLENKYCYRMLFNTWRWCVVWCLHRQSLGRQRFVLREQRFFLHYETDAMVLVTAVAAVLDSNVMFCCRWRLRSTVSCSYVKCVRVRNHAWFVTGSRFNSYFGWSFLFA